MRALRRVAIVLVVLLVLAAVADRVGVLVVQNEAAGRLDGKYGLTSRPSVKINGIPFLTQVISGTFDDVRLKESSPVDVTAGGKQLTLGGLSLELRGATPKSGYQHVDVDHVTGTAVISYTDFNKLMGDDRTTVRYGGNHRLRFTTTRQFLGQDHRVTGTASVVVNKDGATIASSDVKLDGGAVPILSDLVAQQFSVSRRFTELPVGLQLDAVDPEADGVHISLTGTDVHL